VVVIVCGSLLKVYLALHGFSVYIDIESLRIGRFDENLLISIRKSTNFILVLTANALDRCIGDTHCNDWVHKVGLCYKSVFSLVNSAVNMTLPALAVEPPAPDKLSPCSAIVRAASQLLGVS